MSKRHCNSVFAVLLICFGAAGLPALAQNDSPASDPAKPESGSNPVGDFFRKLGNSVSEGVSNGVQMSGSVRVIGHVMMQSKLTNSMQPAYCLENAETGKLITVAPVFGTPAQRADGTIGFTQMSQPVSAHKSKIEVNIMGTLPGNTCEDLIKRDALIRPTGALAQARPAAPADKPVHPTSQTATGSAEVWSRAPVKGPDGRMYDVCLRNCKPESFTMDDLNRMGSKTPAASR